MHTVIRTTVQRNKNTYENKNVLYIFIFKEPHFFLIIVSVKALDIQYSKKREQSIPVTFSD